MANFVSFFVTGLRQLQIWGKIEERVLKLQYFLLTKYSAGDIIQCLFKKLFSVLCRCDNMAASLKLLILLKMQLASCLPLRQAYVVMATCYGAALIGIQLHGGRLYQLAGDSVPSVSHKHPALSENLQYKAIYSALEVCLCLLLDIVCGCVLVSVFVCSRNATQISVLSANSK